MDPLKTEVVVVDIRMRFGSMVVFMVKWAVASIPALLILKREPVPLRRPITLCCGTD